MSLFASIGMLIAFQGLSNLDRDETYAFCATYWPGEGSRLRGFRWRRRGTVGRNEASHARHKAACQCGPKMSDVIGAGRLCSRAATLPPKPNYHSGTRLLQFVLKNGDRQLGVCVPENGALDSMVKNVLIGLSRISPENARFAYGTRCNIAHFRRA